MSPRARVPAAALAALACASAPFAAEEALAKPSGGTPAQRAWVRSAATRFVTAELARDGAGACGILVRRLRATVHGRTCEERWNARLAARLRRPGERGALHRELREIASARVVIHGDQARIELAKPLLGSSTRFRWTENCWMLEN